MASSTPITAVASPARRTISRTILTSVFKTSSVTHVPSSTLEIAIKRPIAVQHSHQKVLARLVLTAINCIKEYAYFRSIR